MKAKTKRVPKHLMPKISVYEFYMFDEHGYRCGYTRPRVHGGVAIIMNKLIMTPALDEVETTLVRFSAMPHKVHMAI